MIRERFVKIARAMGPVVLVAWMTCALVPPSEGAKRRASRTAARQSAGGEATATDSSAAASGTSSGAAAAKSDDGMTLKAGQDGTVFKSLTVEGEDRIHVEFDRPALQLELDPEKAPGLEWGTANDVLNRTVPDLSSPLTGLSARQPSPYVAHPWLSRFASGAVARFRPDVQGVERWRLVIANARGETVATYQGRGEPPREIAWDGRSQSGAPVVPGLTYSYVLEAYDRAGNKRNFVGQGFQVSAYRLDTADGPLMVFSGRELGTGSDPTRAPAAKEATSTILIEAATWLNRQPRLGQPVRVTATTRTLESANTLGSSVARQLAPYLIGDPARIQTVADVQPDAPEGGTVRIALAK
ncbi:MAG TPA: hypothetical protein VGK93_04420 [Candidatus Eisenbacteria bacterium]|jgi:hypothetical protein